MLPDLRLAFRSLAKTPGFTLVAVLTLALGIGTTATVFSWTERVLLNPLPGVADAGRVVALETRGPSGNLIDTSYPDFRDFQAQARSFSHLLVFKERPLTLGRGPGAERIWGQMVSGNFFAALGIEPRLGRFFAPPDRADEPAAEPVAVISDSLWRRRFAGDPGILGRTIRLNQHDFTVVGVAPAGFLGTLNGLAFEVWVPVALHARLLGASPWLETRNWRALHTLGRLAPGATLDSAGAELAGLSAQLTRAYPDTNRGITLVALPVTKSPHGVHRLLGEPLVLLLGVCGLLLVIVCANLSNLLLVRASARQREMCIRQALGAGRFRLVRQLLVESLLLSALGALVGLVFTLWLSDLLRLFIPDATLPVSLAANVSGRVLLVAVTVSTGAALLAGLAPALWAARPDLIGVLRASGGAATTTVRAELFRRGLVVAQVTLAVVTLVCAALALKSFYAAKRTYPGFAAPGVLLGAIKPDTSGYDRTQALAFLDRLQERLATLPGVESAALAENVPLGLSRGSWEEITAPGYVPATREDMRIYRNLVSPGYFSLLRIPLLGGREFTDADRRGAPDVAIVSETFARRFFGTTDAVGRQFSVWRGRRVLTIVGVVADIKVHSLTETDFPYYYVPLRQFYATDTGLAVHLRARVDGPGTAPDPLALLPALRAAVREVDPGVAIFEAVTLEDYTSASRFAQKTAASLLAVLSAIALALTSLGLYGVLAFAVARRTAEIGVRLALGARPGDIARLIMGQGAVLVGLGLGLGLLLAAAASFGMARVFPGIAAFEPFLLLGTAVLIVAAALLACWLPARRATRVDPMVALRAE